MGKASSTTVAEMARPASLSQYQHRSVRQYQKGVQLARGIARHHALWIDYELICFNGCVERIILQTVPHLRTTNMKIEGFALIVLKFHSPSQVAARCGSHGVSPFDGLASLSMRCFVRSWVAFVVLYAQSAIVCGQDHLRGDLAPPTADGGGAPPATAGGEPAPPVPARMRGGGADSHVPEADASGKQCRSAFIRPHLVVDDEGYVCDRKSGFDRRGSQCCIARTAATKHTCKMCDAASGCCLEYEHCVSCCLDGTNQGNLKAGDVWEQCIDRCRTSSKTIEGVWNGYRTDLKHCYGSGDPPDYMSATTQISMDQVTTVKADRANQNCHEACQAKGKKCLQAAFHHINKCDVMRQHFECSECEDSVGPEQPAFVVPDAPSSFPRNRCLVTKNPRAITCEASHKATQRLCVCQS